MNSSQECRRTGKIIEQPLYLFSVIFRKVINLQVRGCVTPVSHEPVLLLCRGSSFAGGVALGSSAAELRTWLGSCTAFRSWRSAGEGVAVRSWKGYVMFHFQTDPILHLNVVPVPGRLWLSRKKCSPSCFFARELLIYSLCKESKKNPSHRCAALSRLVQFFTHLERLDFNPFFSLL